MECVYIKPGVFMMGSEDGNDDGKPVHEVAITRGFYVGKYEVAQAQYEAVTGANPSKWKEPDRPVEQIKGSEVAQFCRLAAERTGRQVRLPTEAEWEYACRAGSVGTYCFGNDTTGLGDYAWYEANSGGQAHPVGRKKPNAWGLYDMHGNVCEWVADRYAADYYASSPRENPTGPDEGQRRVLRGGSQGGEDSRCRSGARLPYEHSRRRPWFGFRVAVSASAQGR